jgi:hypothetical protein
MPVSDVRGHIMHQFSKTHSHSSIDSNQIVNAEEALDT